MKDKNSKKDPKDMKGYLYGIYQAATLNLILIPSGLAAMIMLNDLIGYLAK